MTWSQYASLHEQGHTFWQLDLLHGRPPLGPGALLVDIGADLGHELVEQHVCVHGLVVEAKGVCETVWLLMRWEGVVLWLMLVRRQVSLVRLLNGAISTVNLLEVLLRTIHDAEFMHRLVQIVKVCARASSVAALGGCAAVEK
jgi:hypothetical protein